MSLIITQFFGWRSDYVYSLNVADIKKVSQGWSVSSRKFKTKAHGLPTRFMLFSALPMVERVVTRFLKLV